MDNRLEAHVELANKKLGFIGRIDRCPPIVIDDIPPLGDGEGYRPLDQHPNDSKIIEWKFVVASPDASEADVQKAIDLTQKRYCPVWEMLKGM